MIEAEYVRFTEESNALDYLEKTIEFIRRVEANPTDWKWVIIALHGALYGFLICALKGTNPDNVVVRNKKGESRLISFAEALKRCQDQSYMVMTVNSKTLQVSPSQKRSIGFIQEHFRNAFAHYQPCLWSIELHGMPKIVMDGLDVVGFLSLETGNYTHLTTEERSSIEALVAQGKELLQKTRLFREAQLAQEMPSQ
jgi:hypothetical protein